MDPERAVDSGVDDHVLPMGAKRLHGFGVSSAELAHRLLATFDHSVDVLYGSHRRITSIVLTPFLRALSAGIALYSL
jgi:hypothetical protein